MNKNQKMLDSFTKYCKTNPSERFFQALRNWARENVDNKAHFILFASSFDMDKNEYTNIRDTFDISELLSNEKKG